MFFVWSFRLFGHRNFLRFTPPPPDNLAIDDENEIEMGFESSVDLPETLPEAPDNSDSTRGLLQSQNGRLEPSNSILETMETSAETIEDQNENLDALESPGRHGDNKTECDRPPLAPVTSALQEPRNVTVRYVAKEPITIEQTTDGMLLFLLFKFYRIVDFFNIIIFKIFFLFFCVCS